MQKEINLKSVGGYHFGAMIDLKEFEGSYFEDKETDTNGFINKANIFSIKYNPDNIYCTTDGYAGNCWTAIIFDSRLIDDIYAYKFNFRNFQDLVAYYEKENMKLLHTG
jgi:hypothetical protein